ncbi:iron-containing alcohol dehydrogenase [Crassaminicella thermophila]|uniref:Iron-containing alcohol dehydrogenase n=1 Tax=Crassaminicella thermophila TaxID=2599308 RepID=A0A5C0SIC5_CRATE|nr:iron-containing alcohol dehydrogenase [Crassaminicella thermophila]QEK13437.1 iron-containing alcohol dehydrogenase [Crassaminicella thermophila]
MARFTIPRDLYFGEGAIEELKNLKGKRAVIVIGGGSIKRSGALDKIEGYLKEAGMKTKLIEGVESDPSVETVMNGVKVMQEFEPDWIIGVGGGSPIDAAKAMWIFYEYPEFTFEEAAKPFSLPTLRTKAKFAAITTTSGTGTEVTSFSVITDNKTGVKYPIADYNITPDIAIVDPDLAQTMTPKLVAHTGMDALTHAFEAYVSTVRNEFTDALAIKSIEMMKENLIKSFEGDKEARSKMHLAQCLAGMAFSNAILGIVHSMAHKTGKIFNIPHGCANAIYLPYVIQFNKKTAGKAYANIARRLGLIGNSEEELVNSVVEMVRDFNKKMNIPFTLKEFGISEQDFNDKLEEIAKNSVADPCTGTNPREISVEEMKKLFICAYYGEKVEF